MAKIHKCKNLIFNLSLTYETAAINFREARGVAAVSVPKLHCYPSQYLTGVSVSPTVFQSSNRVSRMLEGVAV